MVIGHKAEKGRVRTAAGSNSGTATKRSTEGTSVGTLLMRALTPLRNLLP
jgi:hypothetical protein